MKRFLIFLFFIPAFIALACSPFISSRQSGPILEEPQAVVIETMLAPPTPEPLPIPEPFFPKAIYQDTNNNFEFDHPASWAFDDGEQHSRGYYVQFYSWDWQPGDVFETIPPGETVLSVIVNYWDPKNDLEAYVSQRKSAWESSGAAILSEERIILSGDRPAAQFTLLSAEGAQSYILFTTVGEQYLTISGSGDLALLAGIAHTLRPIQ